MMKKLLCLCAALALLVVAVPVSAAGEATFAVSDASGKPGDTITVTVSTENNPGIIGLQLAVSYDSNVLELKKAVGGVFSGIGFGPLDKNPFKFNWVDAIHPDNKTNGVLTTLTFRIKEGAPGGKTAISLSYKPEDVFNLAWEDVHFETRTGYVTVGGAPADGGTVATDAALHSVTEVDDATRGLGFRFTLPASGVKKLPQSVDKLSNSVDFSAATIRYQGVACPVVRVGALLSTKNAAPTLNTAGVTNVATTMLLDATATTCSYAVRLQNIPDSAVGTTIYARPYYVIQYQGKEIVVYGTVDATTYQKNRQ